MSRSVHPNERTNVQLPVRPSSQSRRFSTPRQLRPAASIPGSLIRPLLLLLLAVLVLVVVPEIAWMLIDGRAGGTPIDRATRRPAGLWKPIDPLARFTPARLPKTQDRSPRTVVPTL